ncbi:Aldehyde dehydrogenase family 3 member B1 [Colletotrichum higginsianum]|uniref:Aldehyde dehydrogenase family 3 member B1 n=1 Tax=Colletotrichum higginsianum TaxID=80884 RepID=A0A4T0VIU0_9PEZI|nr:Aldehyde dehydrogenase family 3 member B1 [Colletotrichum higginsianum]
MSMKLRDAVTEARTSWQCNYTRIDARWSLKQLHGLYHLILDNRDELAKHASSEYSACANEKDIARLVGELSLHIQDAHQTIARPTRTASAPLLGQLEVSRQPVGVSVVVFGPQNPLHWILGPLASSIAARNVTILASRAPRSDPTMALLERELPKYVDQECVLLVPSFDPANLVEGDVDLVAIYDEIREPYLNNLSFSKTAFFDTSNGAFNLAIVGEGAKSWSDIARELQGASNRLVMQQDRLHAVFVREHDINALRCLLPLSSTETTFSDSLLREGGDADFEAALLSAKADCRLLVTLVGSVDQAFDALVALSSPIRQLALLGPEAGKHEDYARAWLPAQIVSIGSVYPTTVPV